MRRDAAASIISPETCYATVDGDRVAYQILGEGPYDLLYTTGFWSHLDIQWEDPELARFMRRLGSFARLIRFDRRGTGLSDRPRDSRASPIEDWLQDCAAVLDAADASAPIIVSTMDSGPVVLQFVDRHPQRCAGLIFVNTMACWAARSDYSEGHPPEAIQRFKDFIAQAWGRAEFGAFFTPSQAGNDAYLNWFAKLQRSVASPRTVVENLDVLATADSRATLPRVKVPTLVMTRREHRLFPMEQARYLAGHIAGAGFVELPGADGSLQSEAPDLILDRIEEFVTGMRRSGEADRSVVTVMFTDIAGSTPLAARLGNAAWRQLLDRHDQIVREHIARFRGRFVESAGDGTLSTFDSPGRAIDCALVLHEALRPLGIDIRVGLHTGEVELRAEGRVGGMAVHIGARITALAKPGEVLASHIVQGILIGSRYAFEERGAHELKGIPAQWPLFAVAAAGAAG